MKTKNETDRQTSQNSNTSKLQIFTTADLRMEKEEEKRAKGRPDKDEKACLQTKKWLGRWESVCTPV